MLAVMIKLDLLEKFQKASMPNLKNINAAFARPPYDPTGEYSAIYSWGITGIAYNKKFVEQAPAGWADFWQERYRGRVVLFDDGREVLGMALKKNGYSNSTRDQRQLAEALADLKKLSPNILAYDSENIKQKFIAEEAWIGMMWSSYAALTQEENPAVEFAAAEEHGLIWADTLAIPKKARNKALAEKFINYLYEPEVSAKNFESLGYIDPNEKAGAFHSEKYKNNRIFKTTNEALKNSEWLTDVGEAAQLYDRYWTELKTNK
jgi:spermidine/putrescine transport system substrate-binding protein